MSNHIYFPSRLKTSSVKVLASLPPTYRAYAPVVVSREVILNVSIYIMMHVLSNQGFNVQALPPDTHYAPPLVNNCECNTVVYSLMSACADCQNSFYSTQVSPLSRPSTQCSYSLQLGRLGSELYLYLYLDVSPSPPFLLPSHTHSQLP